MNALHTISRIAAPFAALAVVVPAQAASTKPAAMSAAEYYALTVRSESLNRQHGDAVTRLSARQFEALYDAGAWRLAPQELAALVARSVALNRMYGPRGSRS